MHIPVGDILAQDEGYRTSFRIADEAVELEDLTVDGLADGEITLGRTAAGIAVDGTIQIKVVLECHRCLQDYAFGEELTIQGEFSRQPQDDQWPIAKDLTIDLAPLIRQEALLGVPIKQLCRPDCPGLNPETGQPIELTSAQPTQTIKKGS